VLSLTNVQSKFQKLKFGIGFLLFIVLISGCSPKTADSKDDELYYRELSAFRKANDLIENGEYSRAQQIYLKFLDKYPKHPYADDAAYRVAYLHVIASQDNPYFDYRQARILFQNFIENYENSRYISACKNWIHILDLCTQSSADNMRKTSQTDPVVDTQIQKEIQQLREENARLKENLDQLQKAIER